MTVDAARQAFLMDTSLDIEGVYDEVTIVRCRKCGQEFSVMPDSEEYLQRNYGHACDTNPPANPILAAAWAA